MNVELAQNWVALSGNIAYDGKANELRFDPARGLVVKGDDPTKPIPPVSEVRSNIEFEQGRLTCEVTIAEPNAKFQISLQGRDGKSIYAGLNVLGVAYGFASLDSTGHWEGGGGTGYETVLPVGRSIPVSINVRGSTINLNVDGVDVARCEKGVKRGPVGMYIQSTQEVIVSKICAASVRPECFVAMQFAKPFDDLYGEVIRPVCQSFGLDVNRVDDICAPGEIMGDIINSICSSIVVIADVSPDNPNVFYEVGYAHGVRVPTILMCNKADRDKLPFDISGHRTIFYDDSIGGKKAVEDLLRRHLGSITAPTTASRLAGSQGK